MSKILIGIGLFLVMALILTISSCSKTTTVLIDNSPAITGTVQFYKTIVPIFSKSCAISGCHSGSVAPNLSDATAYNALATGNYLNLTNPAGSDLYLWLTGKKSATMPLGSANNPSNINALILAWIKQGAKNN